MTNSTDEVVRTYEEVCKRIMDSLTEAAQEFRGIPVPQASDDYPTIHKRLLQVTATEQELSHIYRKAIQVRNQVETRKVRAEAALEDAKMEAINSPGFTKVNSFDSRPEKEARIRSMTYEYQYSLTQLDILLKDVWYLVRVIESHQKDANNARKDIDTRLRIMSMEY